MRATVRALHSYLDFFDSTRSITFRTGQTGGSIQGEQQDVLCRLLRRSTGLTKRATRFAPKLDA